MSKSDGLKNVSKNLFGGDVDEESRKNIDWVSAVSTEWINKIDIIKIVMLLLIKKSVDFIALSL